MLHGFHQKIRICAFLLALSLYILLLHLVILVSLSIFFALCQILKTLFFYINVKLDPARATRTKYGSRGRKPRALRFRRPRQYGRRTRVERTFFGASRGVFKKGHRLSLDSCPAPLTAIRTHLTQRGDPTDLRRPIPSWNRTDLGDR